MASSYRVPHRTRADCRLGRACRTSGRALAGRDDHALRQNAPGAVHRRSPTPWPYGYPWSQAQKFEPAGNLADTRNGALPAVAQSAADNPRNVNDGWYGPGSNWRAASANSWFKVDLGAVMPIGRVRIGRDRTGSVIYNNPGRFRILIAADEAAYADGDEAQDEVEYRLVFDSAAVGFYGEFDWGQTAEARFPGVAARYVKVMVERDDTAIDEIEVLSPADELLASGIDALVSASPPVGLVFPRPPFGSSDGAMQAFDTQDDLAFVGNGAKPAVASGYHYGDVVENAYAPSFANDGHYGNGSMWRDVGGYTSWQGWIKIDLGREVEIGRIKLGRDRLGSYNDLDPGAFRISVATTDNVYATYDASNDDAEYQPVFATEDYRWARVFSLGQSIEIRFPAVRARFVKIAVGDAVTGLDEIEVFAPPRAALVVDYPGDLTSREGATLSRQVIASGGDGSPLQYSATGLPAGLAIDPATGSIAGRVAPGSAGMFEPIVEVRDGVGNTAVQFTWRITANQAPVAVDDSATVDAGVPVVLQPLANDSDLDGDALAITDLSAPAGGEVRFADGGAVVYTPYAGVSGLDTFTYSVSDGFGGTATATVGVQVIPPPVCAAPPAGLVAWWRAEIGARDSIGSRHGSVIGGVTSAPGHVGRAFSFDGVDDYIDVPPDVALLGLTQGTLELWTRVRSLDTDTVRLFSVAQTGQPFPQAAQWTLDYRSNGSLQVSTTRDGNIALGTLTPAGTIHDTGWHHIAVVSAGVDALQIYVDGIPQALSDAFVGGAGPDLFFGHAAGADNIRIGAVQRDTVNAEGVKEIDELSIYDRPLSADEIQSIIASGATGKCFTNRAPVIGEVEDRSTQTGTELLMSIPGDDTDGDVLTYSVTGLPPGLTINETTGFISGTSGPDDTGEFVVNVVASDGLLEASVTFRWTVRAPNAKPTLVTPADQTSRALEEVSLALTAHDPDGDALTFTATDLPDGLAIDGATGVITGKATIASLGHHEVVVMVKDGHDHQVSKVFEWLITEAAPVVITVREVIAVADAPGVLPSAMITVAERIAVADDSQPMPSALVTVNERIAVDDQPAVVDTPTGSNIVVVPTKSPGVLGPASLTFSTVIAGGNSTVAPIQNPPPLPVNVALGNPAVLIDVSTTALFSGPVTLAFDISAMSFVDVAAVRVLHFESNTWVDRTVSVDPVRKTVVARVMTLSPFAIVEPVFTGRQSGAGRIDSVDGGQVNFVFGVAEPQFGSESGAIAFSVTTRPSGRGKPRIDRFTSLALTSLTLSARGAAFSGVGEWNGVAGFTFEAHSADEAEPGRGRDSLVVVVRDSVGTVVTTINGRLNSGNVQARR